MKRNPLLALLMANARKGSFRAEANTIYLYDMIVSSDAEAAWWGGVSPEAFAKALAGMSGDVALRINSPGGDVFAARAMVAAMRGYAGTITAYVDGYAASAASLVAVAAPRVVMAEGSFLMIHKAWTLTLGNEDDHNATAALLGKVDGSLAETYAARGKGDLAGDVAAFARLMADETWFDGRDAVAAGLADECADGAAGSDVEDRARWNMSAYRAAPAASVAPAPAPAAAPETVIPAAAPAAAPDHGRRARLHAARMAAKAA